MGIQRLTDSENKKLEAMLSRELSSLQRHPVSRRGFDTESMWVSTNFSLVVEVASGAGGVAGEGGVAGRGSFREIGD
jgi:hypothetical protein